MQWTYQRRQQQQNKLQQTKQQELHKLQVCTVLIDVIALYTATQETTPLATLIQIGASILLPFATNFFADPLMPFVRSFANWTGTAIGL